MSGKFGLILTLLLVVAIANGCVPLPEPAPAAGTTEASGGRELPLF